MLTSVRIRNSALTSFLQEQNISAAEIRRRYQERQEQEQEQNENGEEGTIEENEEEHGEESNARLAEVRAMASVLGVDDDSLIAEARNGLIEEEQDQEEQEVASKKRKGAAGKKGRAKKKKKADESDEDVPIKKDLKRGPARRRNFAGSDSSDNDDDPVDPNFLDRFHDEENNEEMFRSLHGGTGRIPGQTDFCASCHCKFTVTLVSEPAPPHLQVDDGKQHLLLCPSCSKENRDKGKAKRTGMLSADAIAASRMQRKRVAAALLDRKELKVPSLLETCISVISTHIDDVEALGDIGTANQDRLSRILSRNRSLNSKTIKLFLDPSAKNLEFWDCSEVSKDSLMLIPAYCPNIESLTLSMCGHLTSEVLSYFATNLPHLKSIMLDGAFLVSSEAWGDFFLSLAGRIERIDIRNNHRFNSESLAMLVESCPQITHLSLHRMSGLIDPAAFLMLPMLSNLVHLDLSHPPQELVMGGEVDLITDETLTVLLNTIGAQLETLVLDGCSELSDSFISNALRPCCCGSRLSRLSLAALDRITDSAVADLFQAWRKRHDPALTRLSTLTLDRCYSLGDAALTSVFAYTRPSLVQLSIAALPDVTEAPFESAFVASPAHVQFPNLTGVNFSFVRPLTNRMIEGLAARSPNLEYIEIFGVPKVNRACQTPAGLKIIGRQDDYV